MAKLRHRLSASSAGLVLLVHLATSVLALADGGVCPHHPPDPTWKNSISAEEISVIKTLKKRSLRLEGSFEQGATVLLNRRADQDSAANEEQVMTMAVKTLYPSNSRGIYKVSVVLVLKLQQKRSGEHYFGGVSALRQHVEIIGDGTFDEPTGELCVLGCILSVCKYKLRLKYPTPKTIRNVTTEGTLTSVGGFGDQTYFDPVSIHGFDRAPFRYTMNATVASKCATLAADVAVGKLWNEDDSDDACFEWSQRVGQRFDVAWNADDCEGANCTSPFTFASEENTAGGKNPPVLRFWKTFCAGNRLQAAIEFTDRHSFSWGFTASNRTLLAEGVWNAETGQMCMIACRLHGKQECDVAITAQFPLTYTVVQRSTMLGHIQSLRNEADPAYFNRTSFRATTQGSSLWVLGIHSEFGEQTSYAKSRNQPEYVYTKVESAKAECADLTEGKTKKKSSSGKYPSVEDSQVSQFYGTKDISGMRRRSSFVQMKVFTRGNKFVENTDYRMQRSGANVTGIGVNPRLAGVDALQDGIVNVSYSLQYPIGQERAQDGRGMRLSQEFGYNMAGEGIYDSNTGKLCLVGCRAVDLKRDDLQLLEGDPPKDCQTFFSIQLPPIGSTKHDLNGTVKSLRDPKDPLYFQPESFSGNSFGQAADTLWRIDVEIVLSVLMLSLTVLCLLRQVQYGSRYPESLPYVSITTMLLLCLVHMIPLILDFEEQQQSGRKKHRLMESVGGWPEVNKVVVRFVTMAAMLLQLRLLQLVWKSRAEARLTGKLAPAVHERRVLYYVVPLYVAGGLIAVLFHATLRFKPHERQPWRRSGQGGVWWGLQEYGGLVLDLHLLPQAMANVLWDATEQAPLSMPFYMGMAAVRSVPHVYDLCRQLRFVAASSSWEVYEYANPEWDFYSGSSDVLIPGGVVLLAAVVWLQQRWGGRCVLPRRWRSRLEYEKVENPIEA